MKPRARAIALVVIQCLLVSSIAAKYLYERATRRLGGALNMGQG